MKSLPFGTDLILLLEQYRGQQTTIARKLCLQLFRHLRHKLLYVLLPVLGLIKKSHSCFNFFDNLAIEKTPFTHLDKGCQNAHPKSPDFKKIFNTPSLVWNGKRFLGGVFEKIIKKYFSLSFLNSERNFATPNEKSLKSKKSPPDSLNREEKVVLKFLNCKLMCRNYEKTVFLRCWKTQFYRGILLNPPTN